MAGIVSLIPSATEIVAALGFEEQLVGRSHECDFPPGVSKLPIVTEPRTTIGGTSAEIDRQVKDSLLQAVSIYQVKNDVLTDLGPDLIITQSQCEVCAVSVNEVEQAAQEALGGRAHIVDLNPKALDDVFSDIERVAEALGVKEKGAGLVQSLRSRLTRLSDKARSAQPDTARTVVCLEWLDPLMTAGHWVPSLVEAAGGSELLGKRDGPSEFIEPQTLMEADPDVLVLMPCGFGLEKTREEAAGLKSLGGWKNLKAVRTGQVYVTDGHHFFNRPGPRLVESAEILAEIFYPAHVPADQARGGWEAY